MAIVIPRSLSSGALSISSNLTALLIPPCVLARIIVISLLIVVMARPQTSSTKKNVSTEGIDIVLAIDVSTSMLAEDFKPNRIEAAKKTAQKFIESRHNDRIGLVIFSGESFTQCPITIDHDVLKNLFKSVKSGMIEDGTAIGMGLATSVSRLKDSKADSKVIILLTDGENNRGRRAPREAAQLAAEWGIKIYCVGVGGGDSVRKVQTIFGTQMIPVATRIDERMLQDIADVTGGIYRRADTAKALKAVYEEIGELEKSEIESVRYVDYKEIFAPFAVAALLVLLAEVILAHTLFRRSP